MKTEVYAIKAEILRLLAPHSRLKILECLRSGQKYTCEIVLATNGEQSDISRHISLMQKRHLVTTRNGVKVIVKVKAPKIFDILDGIGFLLGRQILENRKLVRRLA